MKRRAVLLMSHGLNAGGGERQLVYTALGLRRYQAHVAAVEGGQWVETLERAGVPVHWVRSRSLLSGAAWREGWRLNRYLREHGIGLVQAFDYTMNLFGAPVARLTPGVRMLTAQRCEMKLVPGRYRRATRWAHALGWRIVVNSRWLGEELVEQYGEKWDRIQVCANGIDTERFAGERAAVAEVAGARLVVGTVCVLRPEKNVELLIRSFGRMAGEGDVLLIVGSGPERERLGRWAAEVPARVVFVPSSTEVERYLGAMDVFVLPSRTEGLSNALMEAMASGCAVAATRVGGNPELVRDGETGLLFEDGDEVGLEAALRRLRDAGTRQRLAAAAGRWAREEFSLGRMIERTEELYDRAWP
jgi:glycosyltransferase involved in cell wall biosynthesis